MKKLYRIKVLHGGPKDSHESIETYIVADDDLGVAEWINEHLQYGYWKDSEEPRAHPFDPFGDITLWEYVLYYKGDLGDKAGWDDAYYGVTKYGWKEVPGATESIMNSLITLGIAQDAANQ